MIFQLLTDVRYNAAQFQVLRYGSPEWNSMLVNCFCDVQNRIVELNLVQYSSIGADRLAVIPLSLEFYKETFTKNFNRWLS
jgi:hypothetical protein